MRVRTPTHVVWTVMSMVLVLLGGCGDDGLSPGDPLPAYVSIAAGGYHTCALTEDGRAFCWGLARHGQTGVGLTGTLELCGDVPEACSTVPREVSGDVRFRVLSGGGAHTCGIALDSQAYCWGAGAVGQLGDGAAQGSFSPVLVVGGHEFAFFHLITARVPTPSRQSIQT